MKSSSSRWAICLEQTLGHRAHSRNLEAVSEGAGTPLDVFHIEYPEASRIRIPWTLRGSHQARRAVEESGHRYDVAFYHTQSVALFAPWTPSARRFVVSVDATPLQMDTMGAYYAHGRSHHLAEKAKTSLYRRVFGRAEAMVAWSQWAADSLVDDYGVERSRITIAHPGAPPEFFNIPREPHVARPRVLFVGGDFGRKGGPELLRAFERIEGRADLTIVSDVDIPARTGVSVERGIRPGSDRLYRAYASADIFCFPTKGDCTPLVLGEAMAAGLPVITTDVGSNLETIGGGAGGVVVEPGQDDQLALALQRLVDDAVERLRMGRAAREIARDRLDARKNGRRVFELLAEVAS